MLQKTEFTLDEISLKYAKFFCCIFFYLVNNYEINNIYTIFNRICEYLYIYNNSDNNKEINSSNLLFLTHTENHKVITQLLSIYPHKKMKWDNFFQFTIICNCLSSVVIFFCMIYLL